MMKEILLPWTRSTPLQKLRSLTAGAENGFSILGGTGMLPCPGSVVRSGTRSLH